jgi:hypothetical protein
MLEMMSINCSHVLNDFEWVESGWRQLRGYIVTVRSYFYAALLTEAGAIHVTCSFSSLWVSPSVLILTLANFSQIYHLLFFNLQLVLLFQRSVINMNIRQLCIISIDYDLTGCDAIATYGASILSDYQHILNMMEMDIRKLREGLVYPNRSKQLSIQGPKRSEDAGSVCRRMAC